MKFAELDKTCPVYIVMKEGEVYCATFDSDYADHMMDRIRLSNIHYIEDEFDVDYDEDVEHGEELLATYGDHAYIDILSEGLGYFRDNDDYETSEGEDITESDIEEHFQTPGLDIESEQSDFDPLDFDD